MSDEVKKYLENKEQNQEEKKFNPDLWKPLGIKPVQLSQHSSNIREIHSFLGTAYKDRNTNQIINGFADNMGIGLHPLADVEKEC